MDTQPRRDRLIDRWRALVLSEEETGRIPLPALDSLLWDDDHPLDIALVAPDIAPGGLHLFVDLEHLPATERLILESMIESLSSLVRSASRLTDSEKLIAILHQGGLGYELRFADDEVVELLALPESVRPLVWGLIEAIVAVVAKYSDWAASPANPVDSSARARP